MAHIHVRHPSGCLRQYKSAVLPICHILFLDGVYVADCRGRPRFRCVLAPTSAELTALLERIVQRVGRHLERRGLLEPDEEQAWLSEDGGEVSPLDGLLGASITYRIAVGLQRGEKAFTLRTLPPADEDGLESDKLARVSGFSLHAGIAARAEVVAEVERYIANPAQALSYKVGALKILELRKRAEDRLGEKFDLKGFHTQVLDTGALPVLEAKTDRWIASEAVTSR